MHQPCELCGRDALKPARAEESAGEAEFLICRHCGLVRAGALCEGMAVCRDGKHACHTPGAILKHIECESALSVLDAAAHDGEFAKTFLAHVPDCALLALAPDSTRIAALKKAGAETLAARIEDAPLETGRFHIVHSCNLLDTGAEPSRILADHWRVLRTNGLLALQVCDAAGRYHRFSTRTLTRFIERAGFELLETSAHGETIALLARKSNVFRPAFAADAREVAAAEQRIAIGGALRARFGKAA